MARRWLSLLKTKASGIDIAAIFTHNMKNKLKLAALQRISSKMTTRYLRRHRKSERRRQGLLIRRARKISKWVSILFILGVIAALTMMYFEYSVPGRAWFFLE